MIFFTTQPCVSGKHKQVFGLHFLTQKLYTLHVNCKTARDARQRAVQKSQEKNERFTLIFVNLNIDYKSK